LRNFFARPDAAKPPFKLNQYGANYEGYRDVFGDIQLVTVPVPQSAQASFAAVSRPMESSIRSRRTTIPPAAHRSATAFQVT
jgi:hypothetical protein